MIQESKWQIKKDKGAELQKPNIFDASKNLPEVQINQALKGYLN